MTSTLDPVLTACWVDPRYLIVARYPVRSLCLEDMQADIDKLITHEAFKFTDTSCVFLHTDELESEGRAALVNVLEKKWLTRARTREEFFKIVKTAVANRMRSVLQQHRFTQKRTGIKPPPRHERNVNFESHKPNEISLDAEDTHLQVSDLKDDGVNVAEEIDAKELAEAIRARCCWFERAVFDQLATIDPDAFILAMLDAMRGKTSDRVRVEIKHLHRIQASGEYISEEMFQKAVLQIQKITTLIMEPNLEDERYQAAVSRLAQIFNLQVPRSTKPMVIRRLFTICARDNWQRVDSEVEDLLSIVGAVAPKFNSGSMQCLGVLYQKGHRTCESCGVKVSCATQSANVGLTEITIPPKLLGSKLARVPIILPNARRNTPPPTSTIRDMEIVGHLTDRNRFRQVTHQGETYFQPVDFHDKDKLLFCMGDRSIPFRLRFCNPSKELRAKLVAVNKAYYVPDTMPASEVIALIDEHTKKAYA